MKKTLTISLIIVILMAGLFVFTGCGEERKDENNASKPSATPTATATTSATLTEKTEIEPTMIGSDAITLTYESTTNKKEYKIRFESNSEDNKIYFDSQFPTIGQIRNENANYMINFQIDEYSTSVNNMVLVEEKKNPDFKEEILGNYNAYIYTNVATSAETARTAIDETNPEARVYATLIIQFEDDSNTNGVKLEELLKTSKVQYILNSVSVAESNK